MPPIRRATAVSIVSETFGAWGKDVLAYLGIYLAYGAITTGMTLALTLGLLGLALPAASFTTTPPSVSVGVLVSFVLALVLIIIVTALVAAFFTAAVTYFAISKRRGTPVSWSAALRVGGQRFLSVLGGSLLLGLLTGAVVGLPFLLLLAGAAMGSIALVIGGFAALAVAVPVGIFLAIALSIFAPAIMIEGVGALEGLSRSWSLTRGRRWSIFGATILVALVSGVIGVVAGIPVGLSGSLIVSITTQVVIIMVTGSWSILLAAMAYELILQERRPWAPPPAITSSRPGGA